MSGAAWLGRAPMAVRALLTSALVAAAGAIAVTVALSGSGAAVSNGSTPTVAPTTARPSEGTATPPSSVVTPPGSQADSECQGLTLRFSGSDGTMGHHVACLEGQYATDPQGRVVLVATCPTALTWLLDGIVLRVADSGAAVAPQCGPGGGPGWSRLPGEPQLPTCDSLVIAVSRDGRPAHRCWFDGRASIAVDPHLLAWVRGSTSYVLVNDAGRGVELAP